MLWSGLLVDVGLPAESYHVGAEDRGASFRDSVIVPRSTITRSESPFSANKRQFSAAAGTGAQAPFRRADGPREAQRAAASPGIVHSSVYLPVAIHEALREVAFRERLKIHDIILEGIEMALRNRGRRK